MAWQQYGKEQDEGSTSKFNEAWLKMKRISEQQETASTAALNPLNINIDGIMVGRYNYEAIIIANTNLLKEVWSKLSDNDKQDVMNFKRAIEYIIQKYPIHIPNKNHTTNKVEMRLNEHHWNIVKKWIFDYELKIRELIGKTGYDSPDYDKFDEDSL